MEEKMKTGDVVVVVIRKRPKVATYREEVVGHHHVVDLGDGDLRMVSAADLYPLKRQPGAV